MAVSEQTYREAIAAFATGVTVITTTADGKPAGMTASAVASLSLDPVLLLVCINTRLKTHYALERAGRFAVNVLEEKHEHLARRFASPIEDKFAGVPLLPRYDVPVLEDAMAYFVCNVHERFPGGDHSIFIGEVVDCAHDPAKRPLVYFRSSFGRIDDPEETYESHLGLWEVLH